MPAKPRRAVGRRYQFAMAALGLVLVWGGGALAREPPAYPTQEPCSVSGHIVTVAVPSRTYGKPVNTSVYLPRCYERLPGKLPVIYLLHGALSDETQWPDLRVQPEADGLIAGGVAPFVVVMPGGSYFDPVDYDQFVVS